MPFFSGNLIPKTTHERGGFCYQDIFCYNFIDKFVFVAYNNIAKEFAKQARFAMCGKETLLIQARFTMCGKETLSKGFGFCQSP